MSHGAAKPPGPTRTELLSAASPALQRQLAEVARLATERDQQVWIVGGLVRDLLLGRESLDIDLVALGSADVFADCLAERLGGQVRRHSRFLTAGFTSDSGFEIDVVRARSEIYESPGSLPVVRCGTVDEDLIRRDFTVNAMALPLSGPDERLVDPFHGRDDLEDRCWRVLHDRSFFDDPTRVLRALRLGHRLGFSLEPDTAALASEALRRGALEGLSGRRLLNELRQLLRNPARVLDLLPLMSSLGLARSVHSSLRLDDEVRGYLTRCISNPGLEAESESRWLLVLCILSAGQEKEEHQQLADRLALDGGLRRVLTDTTERVRRLPESLQTLNSPYERFLLADSVGPIGRDLARCTASPEVVEFLSIEWPGLLERRPTLSGRDLLGLGFPSGPAIGSALEATFEARLEGAISSREELVFAAQWMRSNDQPHEQNGRDRDGSPVSGNPDCGN